MQVPNNLIFNLNPATTPQVIWGALDPATDYEQAALNSLPAGSTYIQIISDVNDVVTSAIVWAKTLSDEAALLVSTSPWAVMSYPTVSLGSSVPNYSAEGFLAYVPGMFYIQTETKPTGDYRTVWLKVSAGGERANWVSIAENSAIEYIIAVLTSTAGWTVTATASWAAPTWKDISVGVTTTEINTAAGSALTDGTMAVTAQTAGIYRIGGSATCLATGTPTKGQLAVKVGAAYYVVAQAAAPTDKTFVLSGSITIELAAAQVALLAFAHDGGDGTVSAARLEVQYIGP